MCGDTIGAVSGGISHIPKLVIAGALLLTIYLGIHLRDIDFEYDFTNLRSNLPASVKVKQKMTMIPKYGSESQSYGIVLADSKADLDEIVAVLEKKIAKDDSTRRMSEEVKTLKKKIAEGDSTQRIIEEVRTLKEKIAKRDSTPTIDKVKTLWTELRGQDEKLDIIGEIRTLADGEGAKLIKDTQKAKLDSLRDLLDVKRLSVEDLPENLLRKFETIDGSQALFCTNFTECAVARWKKCHCICRRFTRDSDRVGQGVLFVEFQYHFCRYVAPDVAR